MGAQGGRDGRSEDRRGDGPLLTPDEPERRQARSLIDVLYDVLDPTGMAADGAKRINMILRAVLPTFAFLVVVGFLFMAFVIFCATLVLIAYFTGNAWAAGGLGSVVTTAVLGILGLRRRRPGGPM